MEKTTVVSDVFLAERLEPPKSSISMVLDTDTYNEIDDQFALALSLLSPRLKVEAVYAAPFHNKKSSSPADGMEKSYEEIGRVLARLASMRKIMPPVLRGSTSWLPGPQTAVKSPAAEDLAERAMARRDGPLYVGAIGAPTNVSSALILHPEIRDRIVVVWLGGHPPTWHTAHEFNLKQDYHASRFLLDCQVPLVLVPCKNVAEHLRVTAPELDNRLGGGNDLCRYLRDITVEHIHERGLDSKVIWDVAPVSWLLEPAWLTTQLAPSPLLSQEFTWSVDGRRHLIRLAIDVDRDAVMINLWKTLSQT